MLLAMSPLLLALAGLVYSCLRVGFVITILVCNIIILGRLVKNLLHRRPCVGCDVFTNVCFANTLNGWIWVGTVFYTIYDDKPNNVFERIACTLEASCIQLGSYFLMVTFASICVYNLRRNRVGKSSGCRYTMILLPWLITGLLYTLPHLATDTSLGTFTGFYRLGNVESSDGRFGAGVELLMCGEHMLSDRVLVSIQYVLIVAPVSAVIVICSLGATVDAYA